MNREERIAKYGSYLYCADRKTLCMGMDNDHGRCSFESCILDDHAYRKRKKEIERRREELFLKNREHRKADQEEKKRIRRQTRPAQDVLREQIRKKENEMNRYYTRGWTSRGDRAGLELAELERRLEGYRGML